MGLVMTKIVMLDKGKNYLYLKDGFYYNSSTRLGKRSLKRRANKLAKTKDKKGFRDAKGK